MRWVHRKLGARLMRGGARLGLRLACGAALLVGAAASASAAISGTGPLTVVPSAGLSVTSFVATAGNNLTTIATGSHQVFGAHCESVASASAMWLKFYNGAPTMGTTAAQDQIEIPAAGAIGGNGHEWQSPDGVLYGSGLYVALTGGQALADNTSVAAGAASCSIYWR